MSSREPGHAAAIIVAGGSGRRMGGEIPKQYLLLQGRPVLEHAIRAFLTHPRVPTVVVVLPPEDAASPPGWLREAAVTVAPGGEERGDSVWNGMSVLPDDADPILIHDGARPLVSHAVISRVLRKAGAGVGAVAALPVADTIKIVDAGLRITGTPDRHRLWQAQTPQGFPREVLFEAHRRARAEGIRATDDAALLERYGNEVYVVDGAPENIKITHPSDLHLAESLASTLFTG
jgi:2-C-methyl-D-erythritol 4-phosphate cytidylyltransferase